MAASYAEGEVFFKRSVLRTTFYNPDDPAQFYDYALIEIVQNSYLSYTRKRGSFAKRWPHQRADWRSWDDTDGIYDLPKYLPVGYSSNDYGGNSIVDRYWATGDGAHIRELRLGGAARVGFQHVKMPMIRNGVQDKWMHIDMVKPIRAIYIPLCQKTNENHESWSTWLMVNFTMREQAQILTGSWNQQLNRPNYENLRFDTTLGLGVRHGETLSINIEELYYMLSIPRQLRKTNVYDEPLVRVVNRNDISVWAFRDKRDAVTWVDWTTVAQGNYGVSVAWKPIEDKPGPFEWLKTLVVRAITLGLSLVPGIGPLLAGGFTIGMKMLTDPNAFTTGGVLDMLGTALESGISAGVAAHQGGPKSRNISGSQPRLRQLLSQGERFRRHMHPLFFDAANTVLRPPRTGSKMAIADSGPFVGSERGLVPGSTEEKTSSRGNSFADPMGGLLNVHSSTTRSEISATDNDKETSASVPETQDDITPGPLWLRDPRAVEPGLARSCGIVDPTQSHIMDASLDVPRQNKDSVDESRLQNRAEPLEDHSAVSKDFSHEVVAITDADRRFVIPEDDE